MVQSAFQEKAQWVKHQGRTALPVTPVGWLLEETLLAQDANGKRLAQGNPTVRELDEQIFRLRQEQRFRYPLGGAIGLTITGGLLTLAGLPWGLWGVTVILALGSFDPIFIGLGLLGIGVLAAGIIMLVIGILRIVRSAKGRSRIGRRIRELQRQRDALLSGSRGNAPPPDAGGGPPPPGTGPEGSISISSQLYPHFSLRF